MSSEIKADKWSPASGTSATIGDSGDTYTIPSGVTLANSGTVTGLPASSISSGTIATARLGSGTASSSTVLFGDQTFKAAPSGTHNLIDEETTTTASTITVTGMDSTYKTYMMDIIDLNTSVDSTIRMRYVYSSGPISNSYYQYAGDGFNSSGQGSAWASNGTDYIQLWGETLRHDAGMSNALRLFISNPSGTSNQKRCFWTNGGQRTGDYTFSGIGSSTYFGSTPAITGLQVYCASGNFDNVTIKLYGVK